MTKLERLEKLIERLQVEQHKELVRSGKIPIWIYDKKISFEKMWDETNKFIELYQVAYFRFSNTMLDKLREEPTLVRQYCSLLAIPYEKRILSLNEVEITLKTRGFYINESLESPYHFAISSPHYKLNEANMVLK